MKWLDQTHRDMYYSPRTLQTPKASRRPQRSCSSFSCSKSTPERQLCFFLLILQLLYCLSKFHWILFQWFIFYCLQHLSCPTISNQVVYVRYCKNSWSNWEHGSSCCIGPRYFASQAKNKTKQKHEVTWTLSMHLGAILFKNSFLWSYNGMLYFDIKHGQRENSKQRSTLNKTLSKHKKHLFISSRMNIYIGLAKSLFGFFIPSYRKKQTNILANPIFL